MKFRSRKFISFRHGRLAVATAFVAVGSLLIFLPRIMGWQWSGSGTLIDLGSEFLGLALAVSILDWFFEQRRLRSDGRRMAWDVFHQVEAVVWVWQGGPSRLETDELLGLLRGASDEDDFAECTEQMLLGLAIQSRQLLKGERLAVATITGLSDALAELAGLARIGEGKKLAARSVRTALQAATKSLAEILDLSAPHTPPRLIRHRSATIEDQERRYAIGSVHRAA